MMDEKNTSQSRRAVLKTIGAASVGFCAIPSISAKESTIGIRAAIKQRKQNNWSRSEWFQYLDEAKVRYGTKTKTVKAPIPKTGQKSDQEISTKIIQGFEKADLHLEMTYVQSFTKPYDTIDFYWDFNEKGADDAYTGKPKDLVKIAYPSNHYGKPSSLDGNDAYTYSGKYLQNAPGGGLTPGGVASQYNGFWYTFSPIFGNTLGGDSTCNAYMLNHVQPNNSISQSKREVFFGYSMLYDNASLKAVEFGTDGSVGFSIKNQQASWTISLGYDEEDLLGGGAEYQ